MQIVCLSQKGQSQQQQKEDEFECYIWAMEQSGVDPLNLPKVEAAPATDRVQPEEELLVVQKEQRLVQPLAPLPVMQVKEQHWCSCRWIWQEDARETGASTGKPAITGQSSFNRS